MRVVMLSPRERRAIALVCFVIALGVVFGLGVLDTEPLMALTGQNDKALHVAAFFVLGILGAVVWPPLPLILFLIAGAAGLELAQHLGPWHEAGVMDIVAGAAGAFLGVGAFAVLRRIGTSVG